MSKLSWGLWALSIISLACTSDEKKITTKSGVVVSYLVKGEGESPAQGEVMSVNMTYADHTGKIMFDTKEIGAPVPMMCDTAGWKEAGMLYEVMALLKIGDSVNFQIPVDDLFTKSFRAQKPDSIPGDSKFTFNVGLESAMSPEAYNSQRNAGQLAIDAQIIETYLSENNIEAVTTSSGLRYIITETGNGPNATAGNEVNVHYNGTLLDGTKFDSSYDRGSPFSFVLGQGRVIQGWDEGIALLNKGAKATLYIPSSLAYGERGSPPVIPANAVLKFDVELVDFQ